MKRFFVSVAAILIVPILLYLTKKLSIPAYEEITLALIKQPNVALVFIAEQNGYFRDESLKVNYHYYDVGRDALQEVIDGKADLATVYNTPFVNHVLNGSSISIISSLAYIQNNTAIVARKDRGILKASDLRGKVIGLPKNTSAEYFLDLYTTLNNVPTDQTNMRDMQVGDMVLQLISGEVDAISVWNPYLSDAQKALQQNATVLTSDFYTDVVLLVSQRSKLAENSNAIIRMQRALLKAKRFEEENSQAVTKITADTIQRTDLDTIEMILRSTDLDIRLDNQLLNVLEQNAEFYKRTGSFTQTIPEFRDYIDPSFLRRINPDTVTIF